MSVVSTRVLRSYYFLRYYFDKVAIIATVSVDGEAQRDVCTADSII